VLALIEALRPGQWIKNLNLLAAAMLNGKFFDPITFSQSVFAFVSFCFLSSASYLINDLVDVKNDRLHPVKKNRPIARGDVSSQTVIIAFIFLLTTGLSLAALINPSFFLVAILFIFLQLLYSLVLKKKAVIDIIGIAFFFILRAYAGEIATGYHLPIWIMLTVIFLSLFIASGKRRSELFVSGKKSRKALEGYGKSLLNFYTTMFAVCTLICYAMFTFLAEPIRFEGVIHNFLLENFPTALDRKWFMITLLPVIFGIMRYGQIIFEMQEGERPERVVATDIPLLLSVLTWGTMMIIILYVI
jgi:decaprenyl-phosphate phosphoribosyltransferase